MTVEEPVELVEESAILDLCYICERLGPRVYPGFLSKLKLAFWEQSYKMKGLRLCKRMISKGYLEPTGKHVHTRGPWAHGLRLTELGQVRRVNAHEEIYAWLVQVRGRERVDQAIRLGWESLLRPHGRVRVLHKFA